MLCDWRTEPDNFPSSHAAPAGSSAQVLYDMAGALRSVHSFCASAASRLLPGVSVSMPLQEVADILGDLVALPDYTPAQGGYLNADPANRALEDGGTALGWTWGGECKRCHIGILQEPGAFEHQISGWLLPAILMRTRKLRVTSRVKSLITTSCDTVCHPTN